MRHRPVPSRAGDVVGRLAGGLRPPSLLAEVQEVWPDVVGPEVAAHAAPVAIRAGEVTVVCDSAVWSQELTLLAADLVGRLNARLENGVITTLRCRAGARNQRR